MGDKLNKWLELDIPEELYLSRNIQTMMARVAVANAPPEETAMAILAIAVGNMMELEERVVALEKKTGVTPPNPRDVL